MSRRETAALVLVLGLALALRLSLMRAPACISGDGVQYVYLAASIAAGEGWYHPVFSPGYSLLIAALHASTGTPLEQSGRLVAAFSSVLACVPAWLLWRASLGPVAAGLGCLVLAVWPFSVWLGSGVYAEPPALLLLLGGLYLASGAREAARPYWALGAGLCWGAAAWIKPEALAWAGIGAAALAAPRWAGPSASLTSWARGLGAAVLLLAAAACRRWPARLSWCSSWTRVSCTRCSRC